MLWNKGGLQCVQDYNTRGAQVVSSYLSSLCIFSSTNAWFSLTGYPLLRSWQDREGMSVLPPPLFFKEKDLKLWTFISSCHLTDSPRHREPFQRSQTFVLCQGPRHIYARTKEKCHSYIIILYEIETNSASSGDVWVVDIPQRLQEVSCWPEMQLMSCHSGLG